MSRFYAITYPIRFEDTMAYGSHHFLTNFRFQCAVRESLFFDYFAEKYPGAKSEYDDLVILTRDGYTRNLAPAMLGERVAVLLSLAQSTRSSIQLCIRTINAEGEPVAAGFQTLVFMDRKGQLVPYPRALDLFSGMNLEVGERLVDPAFAARIMGGARDLAAVFPDEVRALGKRVARERRDAGCLVEVERPAVAAPKLAGDTVFSFPGQGSFDPGLFRELCRDAGAQDLLAAAEPVVQETLGVSLRRLVEASEEEGAKLLAASPDLDQFGIVLTELMLARRLAAKGIVPDAVIGHSFGEIAALCVAGCFTPDVAIRVVAERVRALRQVGGPVGGMMALTAPLARAQEVIAEIDSRSAVTISVVNDPKQTVVSGPRDYLEQLVPEFAKRRIGARLLASRYAFHSPGLASAARSLVMGLIPLPFGAPTIPAYSPIIGRFYDSADALQIAISSHLTRGVDFPQAMQALLAAGMTRIVECGAGGVLTNIVRRNGLDQVEALSAADLIAGSPEPRQAPKPAAAAAKPEPVAIVSMGAVLPGAKDIEEFWSNLLNGTSGIVDLRTLDPVVGADLIGGAQTAVVADKSYSALAGYAADVPWRPEYPFTTGGFAAMSKAQRLLAEALRQAKLPGTDKQAEARTLCLLGSTADGIAEYDDALHGAVARHVLDELNLPAALRSATRQALDKLLPPGDPEAAGPYPAMSAIVGPMLGEGVQTVLLDAACASSLYALDLGVQALRAGEADLAYVGGVFAPGPSGSALFSQFGGLSTTGSHALDKSADGVVFGEGAAILALRRLSDAVVRGETIHAVVTASALSSDGHSVAINVPRAEGQRKAMEAAYRASGIDPQSVQCVEAHATATPVGDATEFKALTAVYGGRDPSLPRIKLGSVKSLLGHTGWLAGAASVIKVIESMKRGVLPPHHGWTAPGAGIDLAASPFDIVTEQQPWPDRAGVPRRAAINGFGFGGTNAHVVIEAFDPIQAVAARPVAPPDIVCVGFGAAFPGDADSFADRASRRATAINMAPFRLPRRKLLMPDAIEQMDTAQFSALASADRALASAGIDLAQWKERLGIVIGSAGKARRGVAAIQRVLADRLHRKLSAALLEAGQDAKSAAAVCDALVAQLKAAGGKPSNAYTLVGMMPNLVAGRVSNVFDFSGPSVVVDTGPQSLIAAMRVAQSYLNHGVCDVILAGGVNTTAPWPRAGLPAGDDGVEPDGATLLVLMRREVAVANNLPILASVAASANELSITPVAGGEANRTDIPAGQPHEVSGVAALANGLHAVTERGPAQLFRWNTRSDAALAAQMGYLRDPRPISFYERIAVPAPVTNSGAIPPRILLVTDQPALADRLRQLPAFAGTQIRCLVPDRSADEKAVAAIDTNAVDLLLVVRDLSAVAPSALLDRTVEPTAVLDLAFLAVRHLHEQIAAGSTKVLALNLAAWPNGTLHPDAALLHGMLKSLARDWPAATVRALAAESSDLSAAAAAVGRELAHAGGDVEIVDIGGQRHALRFARATLSPDSQAAPLDKQSVVVLTGGARGVTAVMAEALLKQYGCRLVLLGRSDPTIVPPALQSLSLDDMDRYETEFYRSERQANPKRTIPELKRAFARLKAAHETWVTTEQLRRLGGVEFQTVDITDPQQLDSAVAGIVKRHGSIDLVVHGAGLQISKRLSSRQLGEFQAVVGTKLNGLRNLVAACTRHVGPDVPFHILTSAFSALGNDGQPDYGAANEAMAALANVHSGRGRWTALGWLGWAAVGMTRGSEYAALGNSRGLRAVLPEEGKALFLELLQSGGGSPAVSLLSQGEIQFYALPIAEAPPAPTVVRETERTIVEFPLSVDTAPYLDDHRVNGVPVLPGTFEVEFALRAAQALRPNHPYLAARNPRFHRFVRVAEQGTSLRVEARLLEDKPEGCVVGIRLLSDFVHRSGVVLQPDVLHFEGEVLTSTRPFPHKLNGGAELDVSSALSCADPYLAAGSPVKLGGMFACLHDIRIGPRVRTARYQVGADKCLDSLQGFISPVLLLDALFRLVGVAPDGDVTTGEVSVPLRGDTFHFAAGVTDRVLQGTPLRMVAANPRIDGEFVATDWGHVVDAEGRVLVSIAGAYARRMGAPTTALAAS